MVVNARMLYLPLVGNWLVAHCASLISPTAHPPATPPPGAAFVVAAFCCLFCFIFYFLYSADSLIMAGKLRSTAFTTQFRLTFLADPLLVKYRFLYALDYIHTYMYAHTYIYIFSIFYVAKSESKLN